MAQAGQEHGQTALSADFKAHADTYRGFLGVVAWGCLLIAIAVTLLVVAFAMGFGWFAGLGAGLAVGVAAGLFMGMKARYWVVLGGLAVLLGLGGAIVSLVF